MRKQKLALNTLIDIEETYIRLALKKSPTFALNLLANFRPDASLRQINNCYKINSINHNQMIIS